MGIARSRYYKTISNDPLNLNAITSMVFTPLKFMSAGEAFACLTAILPNLKKIAGKRSIQSLKIDLWPSGWQATSISSDRKTRVEPDLTAELQFTCDPPIFLVGEMKWGSPFTAGQIGRERESVGENGYVFAVVKNRGTLTREGLGCDELRTWKEVHRSALDAGKYFAAGSPSQSWGTLIAEFLELAEQLYWL
jgi:hypothetical protein